MYRLLTLITIINSVSGNPFYHKSTTNIYDVDINIYDNYNCTYPFSSYNYTFKCDPKHNSTYCCVNEFNKLNTTFGPGRCMRFEKNDSYVSFGCRFTSAQTDKTYNDLTKGIAAGGIIIILLIIVVLIIRCVVKCSQRGYNTL